MFYGKVYNKDSASVSSFIDFASAYFGSYRSSSYVGLCLSKMFAVKHISCSTECVEYNRFYTQKKNLSWTTYRLIYSDTNV